MKKQLMLVTSFALVALVMLCATVQAQGYDEKEAREYIKWSSQAWADIGVKMDSTEGYKIFADDFVGTDNKGRRFGKMDFLGSIEAGAAAGARDFLSNTVDMDTLLIRFFGNVAIAQGNELWVLTDGTKGKFYWTDIYEYRNGEWKVIASQDMAAAPNANEGADGKLFDTSGVNKK